MRRLLFTILILLSLGASAQFTNTHEQSNQNTREVFKGGLKVNRGIINSIYPDTATANLNPIAFYHGGMIVIGDTLFLRNISANKWIKVGSGSGSGGLSDGDYGDITVSGGGTIMTIDNGVVTNAKLQNSSITVQGVPISLGSSGDIINGTGFVKASGTTITYDNSTYFSTASEGLTSSGNDVRLFGALATPAQLTTTRSVNLNRNILLFHNSENITTAGGVQWDFGQHVFSPFQFISRDTAVQNTDPPTAGVPWSGVYARRDLVYPVGTWVTQKVFGHQFEMRWLWDDTLHLRTEQGDYNAGFSIKDIYKPYGTGRQGIRTNGTLSPNQIDYAAPALVVVKQLEDTTGNYIKINGHTSGINSYLVGSSHATDTIKGHVFYTTGAFGAIFINKVYDFAPTARYVSPTLSDSSFLIWDTTSFKHNHFGGKSVFGKSKGTANTWASTDVFKVLGNVNITDSLNVGVSNEMTDTLGVDIVLRRRTNGGIERIRADQLLSFFGGLPLFPTTGTGTATGAVVGDLATNNLSIINGGTIAETANSFTRTANEHFFLAAGQQTLRMDNNISELINLNTTGNDNFSRFRAESGSTLAEATIVADFNGGANTASIALFADVGDATITHTALFHLFNGSLRMTDLAGSGSGFIAVDNDGDLSFSAGGVSDGDKGDITVSGGGAVWSIDNSTVTMTDLVTTGTPNGTKFLRDDGQWTTIPGGGDALTSSPLSQFASTTSAQLAGVISNETGTNLLVYSDNPVLVTPDLGTPSAATLTNATGLPISTGVSGLGSGVATLLATFSSANLLAAVTDETGTGKAVFATSPTFTTSILLAGSTSGNVTLSSDALSNALNVTTLSGTGYGVAWMESRETSDFTGQNINTVQPMFNTSGDVFTLQGSTAYDFEGFLSLNHGATSHSVGLSFELGGGATITSISYYTICWVTAIGTNTASQTTNFIQVATNTAVNAAGANATEQIYFRGTINMNAGGTVTPSYTYSAAPGGTVLTKAGSMIRFTPKGTNTFTTIGNVN